VEGVTELPRCRLLGLASRRPSIDLSFELENPGPGDWQGQLFEPIVPWDLRAWADGREVRVNQPMLDIAVRPRTITLAAGERIKLPCPIVLVFEGDETDDPFVWTLDTPPAAVELEATVAVGADRLPTGRTSVALA
jgi:hypothetical protein